MIFWCLMAERKEASGGIIRNDINLGKTIEVLGLITIR
jgi:hypothetical protein